MKTVTKLVLIVVFAISVGHAQAEPYEGDGAWAVYEYAEGIVLVLSLGVYREDPDRGARPTFMINYNDKGGCIVSFGLSMSKEDMPPSLSNNAAGALRMLKTVVEQADFLADDELLAGRFSDVQALDIGISIYARTAISSDTLAAFMGATNGTLRLKNQDAVIKFDTYGLDKTMIKLVNKYCQ